MTPIIFPVLLPHFRFSSLQLFSQSLRTPLSISSPIQSEQISDEAINRFDTELTVIKTTSANNITAHYRGIELLENNCHVTLVKLLDDLITKFQVKTSRLLLNLHISTSLLGLIVCFVS